MFIVTCRLCIIHVWEDNDTNLYVIVTRYGTDVLCLKKADKLTHKKKKYFFQADTRFTLAPAKRCCNPHRIYAQILIVPSDLFNL